MNSQTPTLYSRLAQYRWQLLAVGFILFAIFKTKGGLMALGGFGRILLPLIILYIGIKFIQSRIKRKFGGVFAKVFEAQQQAARQAGQSDSRGSVFGGMRQGSGNAEESAATLVECPKCGAYALAGHACQK